MHYRQLIRLAKLRNRILPIRVRLVRERSRSAYIVKEIFKSTKEKFKNNVHKFRQEDATGIPFYEVLYKLFQFFINF